LAFVVYHISCVEVAEGQPISFAQGRFTQGCKVCLALGHKGCRTNQGNLARIVDSLCGIQG